MDKKKLLWVGDAGCNSGFGLATRHILGRLVRDYHVEAIGVNYKGNPHREPYDIYPAWPGGDPLGLAVLKERLPVFMPDVIVVQNNPWNVPAYMKVLRSYKHHFPTVGIVAVEGKNVVSKHLNKLDRAIFWTDFAKKEAEWSGLEIPSGVCGLGVDSTTFAPGDKLAARQKLGLPERCWDAWIVTNVNRNQHRKRLDLTMRFFAEWYRMTGADAYLYLHCLTGSSVQTDLDQLAGYFQIADRVCLPKISDDAMGVPEEYVVATLQASDIGVNTGLGEGWGLTTLEGASCGRPQVATNAAAVAEWGAGTVSLVDGVSEGIMPDVYTMMGVTPGQFDFVQEMHNLYVDKPYYVEKSRRHRELATQERFDWDVVADSYAREIAKVFA